MSESYLDPYSTAERHLGLIIEHVKADPATSEAIKTAFAIAARSENGSIHFLDENGGVLLDPATRAPVHVGQWFLRLTEKRPQLLGKEAPVTTPKPVTPDWTGRSLTDVFTAACQRDPAALAELGRRSRGGDGTPKPFPQKVEPKQNMTDLMIRARKGDSAAKAALEHFMKV